MPWNSEDELEVAVFPKDERIFHLINQFLSLNDMDMKKNNEILQEVLSEVITFLKDKDLFFRDYFQNIVFAGSYYKGTKVGTPDEFDLNLVIRLPVNYDSIEFEEDLPGYTKLKLCDDSFLPNWENHKKLLTKWIQYGWFGSTDSYLRHDKFRGWMEGLFSGMPNSTRAGYRLSLSKSGPAFTLTVSGHDLSSPISVDLVPVLEFNNTISLQRPGINGYWHAVPKPLELAQKMPEVQWRISFYTLEKAILRRYENGYIKPVIRQIKKLRDKYQLNFASYYIETICLTEIRMRSLQHLRATQLFICMLIKLKEACEIHWISNYWDPCHNLIAHLSKKQLDNMAGLLTRIIKQIKADPLAVANFILTNEELQKIQGKLDYIKTGQEFAPISNEPLKLEENSLSCNIQ